MAYLLIALLAFLMGVLTAPLVIWLRARKDKAWDNSNMMNIYRVVAHLATHPSDFGRMRYEDQVQPFWYINKDELSDVVKSRPTDV